ncbi:hypothetical protein RCOM_1581940 [Ricinus communis]|uniref:WRKY domain-containing protein n=1 Tax=Ricinus communis TaxID=3988 RepID=B9RIR6_RICCO|nr:hypothetical protein RCOM_1581940 [Ricinus communis]|eukprot:XP_002513635.1 probable WRKY transcription factor 27 [Ricinus communis]
MAEDWDLYAIVRSCTSAAVNASNSNTNITTDIPVENGNSGNYLDCLASLTFDDEDDPFSFPDLVQPRNNGWQELQDSYKPFLPTTSGQGNIPLSSIYNFGEFNGQNQPQLAQHQYHHHLQPQQQQPAAVLAAVPPTPPPAPPPSPPSNTHFSLRFIDLQQQLQHAQPPQLQQLHHHHPHPNPHQQQSSQRAETCTLPVHPLRTTTQCPVSRSRKKKSHIKRQVTQVTAENLCNDVWAWRKYGQKPIKGSPYPRNYYRCSSSKGCAARKQVERSNIDPNMFIVSYTGDHTHPRPTHRNSLAGSTRNKFPSLQKTSATTNKESDEPEKAPCSSPLSVTSFSPTTPLSGSMDHEATAANENNKPEAGDVDIGADMEGHRMENDEDDEYDGDDILIPNMTLNEELIKDLQELGSAGIEVAFSGLSSNTSRAAGVGHTPDFGDKFSSWAVGSSAAAAGAAGGSG